MTVGIHAFGAYIPKARLQRKVMAHAYSWFNPALASLGQGERAIAIVAVKQGGVGQQTQGTDKDIFPFPLCPQRRYFILIEGGVMGHVKVYIAVEIKIGEGRTCAPSWRFDASDCGYFGEISFAIVAVEDIFLQAGDVEIGIAVVVDIATEGSHAPAMSLDAGAGGDIGKACAAIVEVEGIAASRCGSFEIGAIDPVNIQVAIIVEVNNNRRSRSATDGVLIRSIERCRPVVEDNRNDVRTGKGDDNVSVSVIVDISHCGMKRRFVEKHRLFVKECTRAVVQVEVNSKRRAIGSDEIGSVIPVQVTYDDRKGARCVW